MRILVTGGAGFVGSSLSVALKQAKGSDVEVIALDNLKRRGSEIILRRLEQHGVRFVHGDIRNACDLEQAGPCDVMLECSAEPSASAGYNASPAYLLQTNLWGAVTCLEHLRRFGGDLVFLSSSRIYPIPGLRSLPLAEKNGRLDIKPQASGPGWSEQGVNEDFPLKGHRTLYGATKLAVETLISEYVQMYGVRAVVNRCGVLAGPWQMGKVDQGFMALWMARHHYGGRLNYIGFEGRGVQVRDVLHVLDLYELLEIQLADLDRFCGSVFNVGGGPAQSVSLQQLTAMCEERCQRRIEIGAIAETSPSDVPWYVTDNQRIEAATGWRPTRGVERILDDIQAWLQEHGTELEPVLAR